MNADGCLTLPQLQAFANGDLSGILLSAAVNHIETCPQCQAQVRELGSADSQASLLDPTAVLRPQPVPASPPTISTDPFLTRVDHLPGAASAYPFLAPPQAPDEFGRLGQYRVLGLLGQGGMAYIFRAFDTALQRHVALKVMKPAVAADMDGWSRFLREAHIMAAIEHDHIVTVHEVGQDGDTVYIAMELLSGQSLDDWMRRTPQPAMADVIRIGTEIASGLTVIHANHIVHRDLKPSNIWLQRKDNGPQSARSRPGAVKPPLSSFRVKILDFGLAGLLHSESNLTAAGTVLGSPAYMSPEQARGKNVDDRSDLFSLGCILYALCAGRTPFAADHTMAAIASLALDTPAPVRELNPNVPQRLADLIDQLLKKNPDDRPATSEWVHARLINLLVELDPTTPMRASVPKARAAARRSSRASSGRWKAVGIVVATLVVATVAVGIAVVALRPWDRGVNDAAAPGAVFLSDMPHVLAERWPFVPGGKKPKEKDKRFEEKEPKEGGVTRPVRVGGQNYPRGIFMHPPPPPDVGEPASLSYKLGKKFGSFKTDVAINEGQVAMTPNTFSVYGDGKLLWKSRPVTSQNDRQSCAIEVKDIDVLKIEVVCPGDIRAAHAVWIDPCVAP